MAKAKPKRNTTISATIEELQKEQETVLNKNTEILLIDIDNIYEIQLDNNISMFNRISYSKSKLLELADNIKKLADENSGIMGTGLLNPVMLRRNRGRLERIHGENRIRALKLNNATQVPAIILDDVSDELARFMRSSENLNREDLNTYDETLSILEHIKIFCKFKDINAVKSFINKIKNFQNGKSSLNDEEKDLHKKVSEVFERVGKFDIITFVDRLSVLNLHPLIKQALIDEQISYTQAKVIKATLKEDTEIIKILDILKSKKLSVSELKDYIKSLRVSLGKTVVASNISNFDKVNLKAKSLSKKTYYKLDEPSKKLVDQKLLEIEKIYTEIEKTISNI